MMKLLKISLTLFLVVSTVLYPVIGYTFNSSTYGYKAKYAYSANSGFLMALSGDTDGDGKKDVVSYKIRSDKPATILTRGEWSDSGLTEFGELIPSELTGNASSSEGAITAYSLADIDSDGKDEVLVVTLCDGARDSKVSVYRWNGSSFAQDWVSSNLLGGNGGVILSLTIGDTDNDGKKEVALAVIEPTGSISSSSLGVESRVLVFERQGAGSYTQIRSESLGVGIAYRIMSGQIDTDTNTEFIVNIVDLNFNNINVIADILL